MRQNLQYVRSCRWLILVISLLLVVSCGEESYTVFHGGPILSMDEEFQSRENLCVVVKAEKIDSVSACDGIDKSLFQKAEKVNLEGNLLMPGLIESHGHLFYLGQTQFGLNLGNHGSAETFDKLGEANELNRITQPLFGVEQDGAAAQRIPIPDRAWRIRARRGQGLLSPAPLILGPATLEIAAQEQQQ